MKDCIFCNIVKNNTPHHEIWWSDESHIAFLDANPTQRGHTLVIPRKHSENILNLDDGEYSDFLLASKKVAEKMRRFFGNERIAMVIEGLSVDHTHIHLVPIKQKGDLGPFPKYATSPAEQSEIGAKLRNS